jgi:hypothetical protein
MTMDNTILFKLKGYVELQTSLWGQISPLIFTPITASKLYTQNTDIHRERNTDSQYRVGLGVKSAVASSPLSSFQGVDMEEFGL